MTISTLIKGALATAVVAGTLVATSAPASAAVVCNRWHECWRVRNAYSYPTRLGIVIRNEAWVRGHPGWRWRANHEGRGYWHRGHWRRW
jgi:hypothetical protein